MGCIAFIWVGENGCPMQGGRVIPYMARSLGLLAGVTHEVASENH